MSAAVTGPLAGNLVALPGVFELAATKPHGGLAYLFLVLGGWAVLLFMICTPPVVAHLLGLALVWYVERRH